MKNDSNISLLLEGYPRTGYQTYARIAGASIGGLCIGRLHPDYVAQKYGLGRAKRYWLSTQKEEGAISPKSVRNLVKIIRTEMRGRTGSTIFFDGLEYMLLFNDLAKVMNAFAEIDNMLKEGGVRMIMLLDPLTLEQRDAEKLDEAFPTVTSEELLDQGSSIFSHQVDGVAAYPSHEIVGY